MIERDLAVRMFSSRNNFTSTLIRHLKINNIFSFIKENGTDFIVLGNKRYQFSTGDGDYAVVRQGVSGNIGLIFFSTEHSTLYLYEGHELEEDIKHNKINTSGVRLYTKSATLSTRNIMMTSLGFDKVLFIEECEKYTTETIRKMRKRR